jgi:hypothetical protein
MFFTFTLHTQTRRSHVVTTQRPTFAEINAELNALDFTKQQTERGEQQGPPIPRPRGKTRAVSGGADRTETAVCTSPTVLHEGTLFIIDINGKRHRRSFQLVKKPPLGAVGTQLVLLAFKPAAGQSPSAT